MLKHVLGMCLCASLMVTLLSGCGINEAHENHTEVNIPTDSTYLGNKETTSQHISLELGTNFIIDADITYPQPEIVSSYILEMIQIEPEDAATLFFPDDASISSIEYFDWLPGGYVVETANGNKFDISYSITYRSPEYSKYYEIADLLSRYADAYPEEIGKSISFMTMEDAQKVGESAFSALGISFEPVLKTGIALKHKQIEAWQQELLNDPTYTDFGKFQILSGLSDDDDCYYLYFTFSCDGIPIYEPSEPSVQFADNVFPPSPVSAEMIITPNGVQYFTISNTTYIVTEKQTSTVISLEYAIEVLKAKYDLVILTEPQRVSEIWLEYIPVESIEGFTLVPYWCFVIDFGYVDSAGNMVWQESANAERINALTGEDFMYGG